MNYLMGIEHVASMQNATTIAFDCETTGLQPTPGGLRLLQFAALDRMPVIVDCWDLDDDGWNVLQELFNQQRFWLAHNAAFDIGWLQVHGIHPVGTIRCTMLASRILTNGMPNLKHGLAHVVKRYLKLDVSKEQQRSDWSGDLTDEQLDYAAYDAELLIQLDGPINQRMAEGNLHRAWDLECRALRSMALLNRTGLPFNKQLLDKLIDDLDDDHFEAGEAFIANFDAALPDDHKLPRDPEHSTILYKKEDAERAGTKEFFNLNSPVQLLKKFTALLGEPPIDQKSGKPSSSKLALQEYIGNHPVIAEYLKWKRLEKRRQMAETLFKNITDDGFIKASYMQLGADTGRMSCVSGDTILITSRGDFTFEEYLPQEGDLVLTHKGRWMPVKRKLYRGVELVFEVVTAEGGMLCCTSDHKLWTGSEWVRVRDLFIGASLGLFEEVGSAAGKHRSCAGRVSERTPSHCLQSGGHIENKSPECYASAERATAAGEKEGGKSSSAIARESRSPEPYEGQEWFPASQLHRERGGSQRVLDGTGREWKAGVPASPGDGTSFRSGDFTSSSRCASYRWGHKEQQPGQFSLGDKEGSRNFTQTTTVVESIKPMGPVGVWDIEVEGDHSYALYGFLSHNCMSPNLQQIPRDVRFRACVQAPEGFKLVVADYAQMELRLAAAEANDALMIQAFQDGTDLHTLTAMQIYGVDEADVTKDQRQIAKSANFGLLYGSGAKGLRNYAAAMGIQMDLAEAAEIREKFHAAYKGISKWQRENARAADASAGLAPIYIRRSGFRRFLPGENNKLTTRCNTPIQGAGAAVLKRTLGKLWEPLHADGEDIVRLAGVVHDEVILLVREDHAESWAEQLAAIMQDAEAEWLDAVPPLAEAKIGDSWDQAK